MRNHINISPPKLDQLGGLGVIVTPAFDIKDFTVILVDVVGQIINALSSSIFIDIQQSDDGVLWHNPLFSGFITATVLVPRPRAQTAATPTRRFGRIRFTNISANPIGFDYTIAGKTNV
jgi:hypothetical protein